MTRVLARCPDTGNVLPTGIDWRVDGPALPSKRINVFCPDCARIHSALPYLESGPAAPALPALEDGAGLSVAALDKPARSSFH